MHSLWEMVSAIQLKTYFEYSFIIHPHFSLYLTKTLLLPLWIWGCELINLLEKVLVKFAFGWYESTEVKFARLWLKAGSKSPLSSYGIVPESRFYHEFRARSSLRWHWSTIRSFLSCSVKKLSSFAIPV